MVSGAVTKMGLRWQWLRVYPAECLVHVYMHLWYSDWERATFYTEPVVEPRFPEIYDEDLVRDAPRMRYLVAQRLQQIWDTCEPHLDGTAARPDHRYVETAMRATVYLSRLYRLDAPASPAPGETAPADAARMVEAQLAELEARQ